MTSRDIELYLLRYYNLRQYALIPNVSWGFTNMGEADLLAISVNHYVTEIEIKISVSDFRKDKDKYKWKMVGSNGFYSKRIKYFYYCMPIEIYEKVHTEIADIAGVYVIERNRVRAARTAPVIPDHRKLTDDELLKLYRLCMFRYWGVRENEKTNDSNQRTYEGSTRS